MDFLARCAWILDRLELARSGDTWTGRAPAGCAFPGEKLTVRLFSGDRPVGSTTPCFYLPARCAHPVNFYSFSANYMDVCRRDWPPSWRIIYYPSSIRVVLTGNPYSIPWEGGQEGWALALSVSCNPGLLGVLRDWLEDSHA